MDATAEIGAGLINLDRAAAVLSLSGSHHDCAPGGASLASFTGEVLAGFEKDVTVLPLESPQGITLAQ